jgi:drug/metabolite transporter (DMT)-like permease
LGEITGMLAAVLSAAFGGSAIGATRFLAGAADPLAIGSFRFGIGVLLLAPLAMVGGGRWPERRDWPGVVGLGLLFFAFFPLLFNASLIYTTAARGALALSTLPLLTMAVGAAFGVEALTWRKTIGVLIAMLGVAFALLSGLGQAPPGAWRGDCLMVAGALCMALYNVWSRPFIRRSGPIPFTVVAMGVGAACLIALGCARGSFAAVAAFGAQQWIAALYLGGPGGALVFFLWAFAIRYATPTRVGISITVNPIVASLVGALLLGEPLSFNLAAGIVAVFAGIALATLPDSAEPAARLEQAR